MGNPIESILFQVSCYVKFCFSDLYCLIIQLEHYNLFSFLSCFRFWDAPRCLFWNWSFIYWSVVSHNIMFLMYDECAGVSYILLSFFVLYLGVYLYLLYLLTDILQHSFFKTSMFRAVSGLQQNWEEGTEIFPYIPCVSVCACVRAHTHSLSLSPPLPPPLLTTHQNGTLLPRMSGHWHHHKHPKSTVYLKVHSWSTFHGFGQIYNDPAILIIAYRVFSLP